MVAPPALWLRPLLGAMLAAGSGCAAEPQRTVQPVAPAMNDELKSLTDAALDEAVRRTGLDRTQLKVVRAESVTWGDGSLGCPQPGMSYTQALVPGYRIVVRAGAEMLDFHASRRGQLVLCPRGRSVQPIRTDDR